MNATEAAKDTGSAAARGVAREKLHALRERVEPPVDEFTTEASRRVEALADQIRALGGRLDRPAEAHRIARRLERTADYLRYRPPTRIAEDAWETVSSSRVLWAAGGVLAGAAAIALLRAARRD